MTINGSHIVVSIERFGRYVGQLCRDTQEQEGGDRERGRERERAKQTVCNVEKRRLRIQVCVCVCGRSHTIARKAHLDHK
jgi:hypothetical protein